jgi:hypothetical protein
MENVDIESKLIAYATEIPQELHRRDRDQFPWLSGSDSRAWYGGYVFSSL